MQEKLKELALRYEDLQAQLADPSVYGDAERLKTVNRELKDLTPVAEAYQAYRRCGSWPRRSWPPHGKRWSGYGRS